MTSSLQRKKTKTRKQVQVIDQSSDISTTNLNETGAGGTWTKEETKEYKYTNGAVYNGKWVTNIRQGKGELTWKDGSKYVGDFKADRRSG